MVNVWFGLWLFNSGSLSSCLAVSDEKASSQKGSLNFLLQALGYSRTHLFEVQHPGTDGIIRKLSAWI